MRGGEIRRNNPLSESGITEVPREGIECERQLDKRLKKKNKQNVKTQGARQRDGREFKVPFYLQLDHVKCLHVFHTV